MAKLTRPRSLSRSRRCFAALTVWDTQRLKVIAHQLEGKQGMGGIMVVGALALYLDFINLFLLLLRRSG